MASPGGRECAGRSRCWSCAAGCRFPVLAVVVDASRVCESRRQTPERPRNAVVNRLGGEPRNRASIQKLLRIVTVSHYGHVAITVDDLIALGQSWNVRSSRASVTSALEAVDPFVRSENPVEHAYAGLQDNIARSREICSLTAGRAASANGVPHWSVIGWHSVFGARGSPLTQNRRARSLGGLGPSGRAGRSPSETSTSARNPVLDA